MANGNPFNSPYVRILSLALMVQAGLFYASSRAENVPPMRPLHDFPQALSGWFMTHEGYVDDETQSVLRADDTLTREYGSPKYRTRANLFIAYFQTQRTGKAPHSPKNCLPGSGWAQTQSGTLDISVPGEATPVKVNRYVVARGQNQSVVLYWYQARNR